MKDTIRKFIRQRVQKKYWNFTQSFPYFEQRVYFPANSIIFDLAIKDEVYEAANINVINSLIRPGTTMLDIGANIGLTSIPFLSRIPSLNVISVEPSPTTLPYLLKTHKASSFGHRWTILDKAVSDRVGKVPYRLACSAEGAYESILDTRRATFTQAIEVESTTIDNIWIDQGQPEISVIKIDIEGADLLALRGGTTCILTNRPAIIMEWNQTNILPFGFKNSDLLGFITDLNYSVYSLPTLNKIECLTDLDLFSKFTENFLLLGTEKNCRD